MTVSIRDGMLMPPSIFLGLRGNGPIFANAEDMMTSDTTLDAITSGLSDELASDAYNGEGVGYHFSGRHWSLLQSTRCIQ